MNVESLKSELQQVLDNDVLLRKEFNTLKRSLSDYRNQLIMRDEDCKRLQVTIDVLNTKLVVMERDNNTYKAELTSFKELRGTIKDQLQAKQEEIEARLEEIQTLRNDLHLMAANYESSIEELKLNASTELESVKADYTGQINALRSNSHYIETGIREEYENRLRELSGSISDKEQSLGLQQEEQLRKLQQKHQEELTDLTNSYEEKLNAVTSQGSEGVSALHKSHQSAIAELESSYSAKLASMDTVYRDEIEHLRAALEDQRQTLTTNFGAQLETVRLEKSALEESLKSNIDNQISALNASHQAIISDLVKEYEEKLSNTLIHSNAQNSKLNDELSKVQIEKENSLQQVAELSAELEKKNIELEQNSLLLTEKSLLLQSETEKLNLISTDFDAYRMQSSQSVSDQVNELNIQITSLNQSHSAYVNELQVQVDNLNIELKNLGLLFENTTNQLSETEITLETKNQELVKAGTQIEELNARLESFNSSFEDKEREIENYKIEIENSVSDELKNRNIEFDKLLAENSNLIVEIDKAQDTVEAHEYEISILKGELDELRLQSVGKSDYFKETLSNKNFEVTNLEANNAALTKEVSMLKEEMSNLTNQLNEGLNNSELTESLQAALNEKTLQLENLQSANALLQSQIEGLISEKEAFIAQVSQLEEIVGDLQSKIITLNETIASNASELEAVRSGLAVQQDEFIGKLFKQIDELNDQRMSLLDEKEQMANQLLKMNEVIGTISQHVEAENIDVASLNNHRKNVILANNSSADSTNSPMKKQINDLVREIDKCIALLSA